MTEHIQKDMEKTLALMERDIKDFLNEREVLGEQDDDIENLIKVISKEIRRVDVVIELLGDYMLKDENIKQLQVVLGIISKNFNQIFDKIKSLGKGDISSALEKLYEIQLLVIRIQRMDKESDSQSKFLPQSNSLWTLTQELLASAGQTKTALEELVKSFIEQCEKADVETGFSITTLYPKSYFDPLADQKAQIKGAIITGAVTEHMKVMIKKFDLKLEKVKPEDAKNKDDRKILLKYLGTLRLSALCQASIVSSDIVPKIDKLIA